MVGSQTLSTSDAILSLAPLSTHATCVCVGGGHSQMKENREEELANVPPSAR